MAKRNEDVSRDVLWAYATGILAGMVRDFQISLEDLEFFLSRIPYEKGSGNLEVAIHSIISLQGIADDVWRFRRGIPERRRGYFRKWWLNALIASKLKTGPATLDQILDLIKLTEAKLKSLYLKDKKAAQR